MSGPPIVFIAQLGTGGASWKPVLERLTTTGRTFTYDRPGTGSAPPRPAPNPPLPHGAFARELADLLDAEGITEPAVLVGHSFGGNILRVYASLRPERVAGIVFVDCSIPQSFLVPGEDNPVDGDEPDGTAIDTIAGQVEILSAPIPHVPTAVLVRRPHWWFPTFADIPHPAIDDLWQVSQRLLAEQLHAPLIRTQTGHQIPRENPGLVSYIVDAVVKAAGTGGRVGLGEQRVTALGGTVNWPASR